MSTEYVKTPADQAGVEVNHREQQQADSAAAQAHAQGAIDQLLEHVIADVATLLQRTSDKRYFAIQRQLIGLRSPAQMARMERARMERALRPGGC